MKNNKKLTIVAIAGVSLALVAATVTFGGKSVSKVFGDAENYQTVLNGTNGNATVATLKTTNALAKTGLGNDSSVDYKNLEVVSGKIGRIKAGGFYRNHTPFTGLSQISVVSNAVAGDATLAYGLTSACLDGEVDLANATNVDVGTAHYFCIKAKNPVEVTSIGMNYTCDNSVNGYSATKAGVEVENAFKFTPNGDGYGVERSTNVSQPTKVVVPDFVGVPFGMVTRLMKSGSYGTFEGNSTLEKVYIPETVSTFDQYAFYTKNNVQEFTMPYALTSFAGNAIPKGELKVLNIHSKLATGGSTVISSSDHSKLETINVSYDVEFLPNIISSWPTGVTINYEGTEAEWAALTDVASTSSMWKDDKLNEKEVTVICSDTTIANVTFSFENATLGSDTESLTKGIVVGKQVKDPGKPVYNDGTLLFDGWYDNSECTGNKITFPYTVTEDVTFTAKFIEYPAGSSFARAASFMKNGTINIETSEDIPSFYLSYTAAEAETVRFTVSDVTKTSGNSYLSPCVKFYDSAKQLISIKTDNKTVKEDLKQICNYDSGAKGWKIRFEANEHYYMVFSLRDGGGCYGTATVTAQTITAEDGSDYTLAKPYTLGTQASIAAHTDRFTWFTFTPSETKKYWIENGGTNNEWQSMVIGHFSEGVWIEDCPSFNASSKTVVGKTINLTAGIQYYVAIATNEDKGVNTFIITDVMPGGLDFTGALDLTVDGDYVNVPYAGFSPTYVKFEVETASHLVLEFENTKGSTAPTFKLFNLLENEMDGALVAGNVTTEKFLHLGSGTYYLSVSSSSSIESKIRIKTMPTGYNYDWANSIDVSLSTASISLDNVFAGGTFYSFTASEDMDGKFVVLGFLGTQTVELLNEDGSSIGSIKDNTMYARLTADVRYVLKVAGELANGLELTVTFEDSIQDGLSLDTAYRAEIGTPLTDLPANTNNGHVVVECSVSGTYVWSSNKYIYNNYVYDVLNTSSPITKTDGQSIGEKQYIVTLEAGHSYLFKYRCASVHTFALDVMADGYTKGNAIELSFTGFTAELTNNFAGGKTYYSFTAPLTKWYQLTSAETGFTLEVQTATGTKIKDFANGELVTKLTAGDKYLVVIGSAEVKTVEFSIALLDEYRDGTTKETAFLYTLDAEQDYMTVTSDGTRKTIYMQLTLEAGKTYVFCSAADAEKDMDSDGVYDSHGSSYTPLLTKNDVSGDVTKYKTEGSNDFVVKFVAPTDGVIIIGVKFYSSGSIYNSKLYLYEYVEA